MADGRELHYHTLRVTDATGQELPARMHAQKETYLRIAVNDAGAEYPIRVDPTFSDADWTAIAGADFDNNIYAVVLGGGNLYVGGDFLVSPNNQARRIARWNGSSWSSLGSGMNNTVRVLAWDARNNQLYAAGAFTAAGNTEANRIARWDGATWFSLGDGMNRSV